MKKWSKPEIETLSIEETYQHGKTQTVVDYNYFDANGDLNSQWADKTNVLS